MRKTGAWIQSLRATQQCLSQFRLEREQKKAKDLKDFFRRSESCTLKGRATDRPSQLERRKKREDHQSIIETGIWETKMHEEIFSYVFLVEFPNVPEEKDRQWNNSQNQQLLCSWKLGKEKNKSKHFKIYIKDENTLKYSSGSYSF